ncbi:MULTISPECIES: FAD-dependent oxidoreductase [unclassified Clostridioides]|uniref:oxidoreductase n=1 Tax=unclassified Clostridioides TaxID=2635829 RepID=UPI001D11BDF8|nr:FAD-dependent oxidoreductase [Clostridioides sp. ZZV14-6150]MCC0667575.1 FAD-dependent oxidoreductase [Clostridioides sp. ZZV14-6153]MCC0720755.1 FAD-dependent oxidoreductase [Clostridioides sp. ZZV14-6104]MCC0725195.1 FAD-dependent oxidoreductase [Clostridioides sp. ZZV14-6045]MCC0733478.1 FAD-dependent oxidoreductase [Clostridioides sp. ZZV14-6009]MCC0736987.1 FAD-dependent oxidoreductase [Clostridioides sp. ZZV14-5902]MCC0741436.1 FAD-dependent oxidoreductase [Clostridioides sp. ZZV14-6
MKIYQNIFEPLTIKRMNVKNRIVMPPMGTNFGGESGEFKDEHIKYYEQRAKGGTGLIIVENACVDFPLGSNGTTQIRIDHDRYIPALYKLTENLHKHGACVAIQINHSGASAMPERINGLTPVSSSNIPSKNGGTIPRELKKEEILNIAKKYGKAAKRAQIAGFDAVEIHAGHSYLISQFLSPIYNKRTDEFGGSLENRARFAKLVIDKVRDEVGALFPISLRVSADEFIEGGNTLNDTLKLLEYLNEEVDIYNVSAALNDSIQFQIDTMTLEDGWRSYMSKAVKKRFGKATIITGNIRNPEIASKILKNNEADFIGMGRGLIADPNWVEKVQNGKEDSIRKCISCNIGCAGNRIGANRPIRCTVNPDLINGEEYKQRKVNKTTNVVVVGGGTAGLEAAATAAEVGCNVFLLEEKADIGGLAETISTFPDKSRINDFPKYLKQRVKKLKNLIVFKNTKADIKFIENLKPDIIINATGSKPLLPPITGLLDRIDQENGKVSSIFRLFNDIEDFQTKDLENKKVVVVGGGAVGLDVVEFFSENKARTSIVEMLPVVGKDLDPITKVTMMKMLKDYNVDVYTNTALLEVEDDNFKVKKDKEELLLDFDYGFICLGMKSNNPILNDLKKHFEAKNVEVINIGDSKIARRIIDGVREGRNIITTLEKLNLL